MKHTNNIDITMTAVLRPDVICKTLESFTSNLLYEKNIKYRLIINVDNVGENILPKQIRKICEEYFSEIKFNFSENPSFTKAVMWCWDNAESDFVFHLEDDWIIKRKTSMNDIIRIMNDNNDLACIHLMRHDINGKTKQLFGTEYEYSDNAGIFISKRPFGFSLNPVVIRLDFLKKIRSAMVDNKNPEKQIRVKNKKMNKTMNEWRYGIYASYGDKAFVYGKNGLVWRKKNGLIKPPDKHFICWEKENNDV